jgi:hypothetical protein
MTEEDYGEGLGRVAECAAGIAVSCSTPRVLCVRAERCKSISHLL